MLNVKCPFCLDYVRCTSYDRPDDRIRVIYMLCEKCGRSHSMKVLMRDVRDRDGLFKMRDLRWMPVGDDDMQVLIDKDLLLLEWL